MKVTMDGYPVEIGDIVWSRARVHWAGQGWGTVVKISPFEEFMLENPSLRQGTVIHDGEVAVKVQFSGDTKFHNWFMFPGGTLAEYGLSRDLFWDEIAPPIPPPKPWKKALPDLPPATGPVVKKWRWLVGSARQGIQPYDWVLTLGWYSSKEELMRCTNGIVGEPVLETERAFRVHID